jgi:hypothetical protein
VRGREKKRGGGEIKLVTTFIHSQGEGIRPGAGDFTPVILATQEAEIRRIVVQSQSGQIICETLS